MIKEKKLNHNGTLFKQEIHSSVSTQGHRSSIDHFTVVGVVSYPLSEREAEVDVASIQTSFFFLWKFC